MRDQRRSGRGHCSRANILARDFCKQLRPTQPQPACGGGILGAMNYRKYGACAPLRGRLQQPQNLRYDLAPRPHSEGRRKVR
jgi:hypothetical protein